MSQEEDKPQGKEISFSPRSISLACTSRAEGEEKAKLSLMSRHIFPLYDIGRSD